MGTDEPTERKRVLVIDDEPWIAELLARMLAEDGHDVDTAENGAVALAKIGEQNYDLIVCDLRMPELDGPGLYAELEKTRPDLLPRIVFITGSAFHPAVERFLENTDVPCLNKPFTEDDVRRGTHEILEKTDSLEMI
jgi:CheY-like chemotaxis protein